MKSSAPSPAGLKLYNGVSSIADYVLPQLGFIAAGPLLLRHLGPEQLGVWILATTAVSSGVLVSSGFGDAAIRYVSISSSLRDASDAIRLVRCMLSLNLALGAVVAVAVWLCAPLVAVHVAHLDLQQRVLCVRALRAGSILLVTRSAEGVYVSTFRALKQYGPAACITVSTRLVALAGSVALAAYGFGVVSILLFTLSLSIASLCGLSLTLQQTSGLQITFPAVHWKTLRLLASFGSFTWLQTFSALAFSQLDRLVVGVHLGPAALALYAICLQATQPIHATISAGFHVLFPEISARLSSAPRDIIRKEVFAGARTNLAASIALTVMAIALGSPLFALWFGHVFAAQASSILWILALGFGFLSLNVTAHYVLLAVGDVRHVAFLNLLGAAATVLLIWRFTRHFGLLGAACARLAYGPITWLMYVSLWRKLGAQTAQSPLLEPKPLLEGR